MRIESFMLRAFVVLAVVVAGCGDDDGNGSGGGNASDGFDVDKLMRACTILHSCLPGYDIGQCVVDFSNQGTPAQVDCVNAASVADCSAANACVGATRAPDTNCVNRCLDDDTFVQCDGPSMHTEFDCATSLQSGGPQCITGTATVGCGVAACTVDGEATCDGMVSHLCSKGIERTYDCSRAGAECITSYPGCEQPTSGACTNPVDCQGDLLLNCDSTGAQRTQDCSKVIPDGTCIVINNFIACGWGMECDLGSSSEVCLGTTLRVCVLGAIKDVDCTTVGGTKCIPNTNASGAVCSL